MTAAALTDIGRLITTKARVSGGQPCIAGTGVTVAWVAHLSITEGLSAEEIRKRVHEDAVTLAQVHAALAYYYENQDAIDSDVHSRLTRYDELATAAGPNSLANLTR